MARGKYIYLVYNKATTCPVSAHTVKYEAHKWVERSRWEFKDLQLYRMKDGLAGIREPSGYLTKTMVAIDWDQ